LNVTAAQHEVITYPCVAGELLEIVAGPGSGKTKTLIARISYMINLGITPNEILVLSMTNRAVDALRTALAQLVGSDFAASVNIYTFHGFCNKLLLEHGKDFGLDPSWQIIEENGWRTLNSMVEVRNIYSLQKAVNEARTSQDVAAIARKFKISLKSLQKVLRTLKQSHMKTYGDVASEAIQLMTENPALLNNFKCVVVDEFQDVYPAILEMAVAISKGKHLTIAGDPQQAIYEFLGSNPETLSTISSHFPNFTIKRINLDVCFRSTPEIMKAAELVVSDTALRDVVRDPGPLPVLQFFTTADQERSFVCSEIRRLIDNSEGVLRYSDIAVLSSTNASLNKMKESLSGSGIKSSRLMTSPSWTASKVAHLVDLLRVLHNPHTNFPLICALNMLPKVGQALLNNLYQSSLDSDTSLWDQLELYLCQEPLKTPGAVPVLKQFVETVKTIMAGEIEHEGPVGIMEALHTLVEQCLINKIFPKTETGYDRTELELELRSFYDSLCQLEEQKLPNDSLVDYFLKHYTDGLSKTTGDQVNLSTIHSAKGLEFPIAFVLGHGSRWQALEESYVDEPGEVERLLFVAMTRARNMLY
ncbi:hypothetical protein BABINDRAFT_23977, partial [Babjeviella inositovora NRRL Y-12698]